MNLSQNFLNRKFDTLSMECSKLIAFLLFMYDELEFEYSKDKVMFMGCKMEIESKHKALLYSDILSNGYEVDSYEALLSRFKKIAKASISIAEETNDSLMVTLINVFTHTGYSLQPQEIIFEFNDSFINCLK